MRAFLILSLSLWAVPAGAVGILGFDHARPTDPGRVEAGLAIAAGDEIFDFQGLARFGLLPDLEANARAAIVVVGNELNETGFEVEGGAKFRFLRQQDTGDAVELAVMGQGSLLNTSNVFLFGVDPAVVASHHFRITDDRELFLGVSLGLAVTYIDNGPTDTEFGLLGSFVAGVDIIPQVQLALEAKLRDDLKRLGLAVTYLF
ncbi:MAG: hypothetical protein KC549_18460 [Myxococcales bacterium]|nr:hypothetical protein [Myxococcales bacterium]MCB9549754.1 hypothetical protein [Myxococcales bacterium]